MNLKLKITLFLIASLILSSSIHSQATKSNLKPDPEKDKVLLYILRNILTRSHFVVKEMNDDFSEYVFNEFIDGLDPNKRYFTQKDLKDFEKYKYDIDNQLLREDLSFYRIVYERFTKKIKNAKSYYGDLLTSPFNFKKKESIDVDYDNILFAKNETQLKDYWRKQLKLSVLIRVEEKIKKETAKKKENNKYTIKNFKELEKEARSEVLKSMDELYVRIEELEHEDWFSTFLNSVVGAFDPHTTYMAPNMKERFDQDMSGKLEGIGARLQKKGINTLVFKLVSGGPAWKQGELEAVILF